MQSIDLRFHSGEQLRDSLLDLNNVLKFQRVTSKLLSQWSLMRTQEKMARKYGTTLDDPELQRKIQSTVDRLRQRRLDSRKAKDKK